MVYLTTKFVALKRTCSTNVLCMKLFKRNYVSEVAHEVTEKKVKHPYRRMHPWKSLHEFSEDLYNNIIYCKDGLVALNKPYGIRRSRSMHPYRIPNSVNYSLEDALPYLSQQLKLPWLTIVRTPEVYSSGVTLLGADENICGNIQEAFGRCYFRSNTYWLFTQGVPKDVEGDHRLAIKMKENPLSKDSKLKGHPLAQKSQPVILKSWGKNDMKFKRVLPLHVQYKVLSKSINNVCSLIEITSSSNRYHAVRLFASIILHTPVIGDDVCGSRVKKVGDVYFEVDPFIIQTPKVKLESELLNMLGIHATQQNIIPVHIHLRSVCLPFSNKSVSIVAPLMQPFSWAYRKLGFKDNNIN